MANLHYENLPELDMPATLLMKRVKSELGCYYQYLLRAKEWIRNPNNLEKVRWEKITDRNLLEKLHQEQQFEDGSVKTANPDAVWVSISEIDKNAESDAVDLLCEADFVMEQADKGLRPIKVIESNPNYGALFLEHEPYDNNTKILFSRPNDYSLNKQLQAFQKLQEEPEPEHRPFLRLAEDTARVKWPEVDRIRIDNWEFLNDESVRGTEEQRKFVRVAMGTPDFAILEGPPGSGKTRTICEIIVQEVRRGHRVLLCASTHVAVDNVLETLQEHKSTDNDVIAVRIGDVMRVSQSTQKFRLKVREETERKDLIRKIRSIEKRTPSQEYFLQCLETPANTDPELMTRVILQCANLVCGTTIGILQHPDIQKQTGTRSRNATDFYDCLILDEASKTTFQEFLVPGMFARRWIFVGDVNQLSPYVETRDLEGNIAALIGADDATVLLNVFNCWEASNNRRYTRGLVVHRNKFSDIYSRQAEELGLNVAKSDPVKGTTTTPLDLLGAHVSIIEDQNLQNFSNMIPADATIISDQEIPNSLIRRQSYWLEHSGSDFGPGGKDTSTDAWAGQVAWRLIRAFEKRNDGGDSYRDQIQKLLPKWYDNPTLSDINYSLDLIKRVALPSILELLQRGFERRQNAYLGSTLTDGFKENIFDARHMKLSFQHRMHPEISKFPREMFYGGQSLQDPLDMAEKRRWSYSRYKNRAGWIQVMGETLHGKNVNPKEVNVVMNELEAFLLWAAQNPRISNKKETEPWTVAILTFYRGQEAALRSQLRRRLKSGARTNFTDPKTRTTITLCTVDRFQGHEADIVFLSFVRTGGVGFLDSPNRLNVGLTRAKYQLVLIGKRTFFERQKRSDLLRDLATKLHQLKISIE